MTAFQDALAASLAAIQDLGDPFRRRYETCPNCDGTGKTWAPANAIGGHGHWADCWDCSTNPNPDKDSHDE